MPDDILDAAQKAINDAAGAGSAPPPASPASPAPTAPLPPEPEPISPMTTESKSATTVVAPPVPEPAPPVIPAPLETPPAPPAPIPTPEPIPAVTPPNPPTGKPEDASKLVESILHTPNEATVVPPVRPDHTKTPYTKGKGSAGAKTVGGLLLFLLAVGIGVGSYFVSNQKHQIADTRSSARYSPEALINRRERAWLRGESNFECNGAGCLLPEIIKQAESKSDVGVSAQQAAIYIAYKAAVETTSGTSTVNKGDNAVTVSCASAGITGCDKTGKTTIDLSNIVVDGTKTINPSLVKLLGSYCNGPCDTIDKLQANFKDNSNSMITSLYKASQDIAQFGQATCGGSGGSKGFICQSENPAYFTANLERFGNTATTKNNILLCSGGVPSSMGNYDRCAPSVPGTPDPSGKTETGISCSGGSLNGKTITRQSTGESYHGSFVGCMGGQNCFCGGANDSTAVGGAFGGGSGNVTCYTDVNSDSCALPKVEEITVTPEVDCQDCVNETPGTTPTPIAPSCIVLKIYGEGSVLTPSSLHPGQVVTLAVKGDGPPTKGHFRVNGKQLTTPDGDSDPNWTESGNKNANGEFTIEYTVPTGVTDFVIEAEIFADGAWR